MVAVTDGQCFEGEPLFPSTFSTDSEGGKGASEGLLTWVLVVPHSLRHPQQVHTYNVSGCVALVAMSNIHVLTMSCSMVLVHEAYAYSLMGDLGHNSYRSMGVCLCSEIQ